MQETQVRSMGGEDSLQKEMATHSSILAWKMPWIEEPGRLHGVSQELDTTLHKSKDATLYPCARIQPYTEGYNLTHTHTARVGSMQFMRWQELGITLQKNNIITRPEMINKYLQDTTMRMCLLPLNCTVKYG